MYQLQHNYSFKCVQYKIIGQLVMQTRHDKKILKFTCFNDALSSFLKSTDCQTSHYKI